MKQISLTKGQVAIVDDEDFDSISKFKWNAEWLPDQRNYRARRSQHLPVRRGILMHRQIMGFPTTDIPVDHINHNTLDNRKSNLRLCTTTENNRNRSGASASSKSGYRGVSWNSRARKWVAYIGINGKRVNLGYFDTPESASQEFRNASLSAFGKFAGNP